MEHSPRIVPRLESFAGYEPSKKPNVNKTSKMKRNQTQLKKKRILAASDEQETFECKEELARLIK